MTSLLTWTTDKPTTPELYWYRGSVSNGNTVITQVYDSKKGICAAFINDFWEGVGLSPANGPDRWSRPKRGGYAKTRAGKIEEVHPESA